MKVTRDQVVAFRLRANHLYRRLPAGSLADAAFAGLQDSTPRVALVALHARVERVAPEDWADSSLFQIWHRAETVFVVPTAERWVWASGAWPRDPDEIFVAIANGAVESVSCFEGGTYQCSRR